MSQAVTLWIPGLLDALRVKEAQASLKDLKLPALQTLLAKADKFAVKPQSFYEQASFLFHQPGCLPIAVTKASAELDEFNPNHFWLSVDPVQMIPDRDTLVLVPGKALQITEQESKALLQKFNAHFAEDKVELIWASSQHWYLSIVQPVDIQTTDIEKLAYQSVNAFYPKGNAAQYWRQLLNETQMLFYTHPVNEARREQGWPEINSVWVWGEGKIEADKLLIRTDASIHSNHAYLQGMANLTQSHYCAEPESYQAWLNQIAGFSDPGNGEIDKHFICLDSVADKLDNLQLDEWLTLLQQLEENWFAPLLQALKRDEIDSLLLDLGQEYRAHLKPSHLNRFWRFKKPLNSL
ncbi:hypothetical protein THMIRHAM_11910 [Thiomicrorhabdus immobilis]|uniref:Phosphoglycerate mutase n=1 Tax=Thiomicrorhabdus immobilis TaxID=2791037 RepID=A0ABN6CWF4_9GAMM|nr:hypothetical protein [Thiomicrorhabdus immobilis]BCN93406.1 hypothetical protein THMIRHAM_11910 [Thiomicrorhabdus immobilis]